MYPETAIWQYCQSLARGAYHSDVCQWPRGWLGVIASVLPGCPPDHGLPWVIAMVVWVARGLL